MALVTRYLLPSLLTAPQRHRMLLRLSQRPFNRFDSEFRGASGTCEGAGTYVCQQLRDGHSEQHRSRHFDPHAGHELY